MHSLKDIQEENRILKKDNFNLKLKIYYLNEKARLKKNPDMTGDIQYDFLEENLKLKVRKTLTTAKEKRL